MKMNRLLRGLVAAAVLTAIVTTPGSAQTQARHVVVITIDGLRWQEFFGGANRDYFKRDKNGSAGEPERRFWRETPDARRSTLMPFVWTTIAASGQIFGDPSAGSESHLTNGLRFSYPGYSEIFAGLPDPTIASQVGEDFRSAVPRAAPPLPLAR